jgi:uncharacterized iron-regulated protein
MRLLYLTFFVSFALIAVPIHAQEILSDRIYSGDRTQDTSLDSLVELIEPGTIVIVSEIHNLASHHRKQSAILDRLHKERSTQLISVGMEFFHYPHQTHVDAFLAGKLSEPDFLKRILWRGNFDFYRSQVLFPRKSGGITLALNAPVSLTQKVSQNGLRSLTAEEKKLLPPGFELGNDRYFERFRKQMEGHIPPEKIRDYFASQSIWDDTMAWIATQFMERSPDQVLFIIVGDFHATYGGGLPDRIRARGYLKLAVISQVNLHGLNTEEKRAEVSPDSRWGVRADYVWTSSEADRTPNQTVQQFPGQSPL